MLFSCFLLSLQLIPQVYKIYKRKTGKDISNITMMISIIGLIGILIYGLHMNLIELWLPPIVQLVITIITFLMKLYYDKNPINNMIITL
jgi:uncharacterized protein with PQ loop repeat